MYLFLQEGSDTHAIAGMQKSEDTLQESFFSYHVVSRD